MNTNVDGIIIQDHGEQVPDDKAVARAQLEAQYGEVLDTSQMQAKYSVEGFAAPYVVVTRKEDGVRGSLAFTHSPRFYHTFCAD
jgi:hypothetical protein